VRPSRVLAPVVVSAAAVALLAAAPAPAATEARRAYRAGLAAYVYGFPPVVHRLGQAALPVNQPISFASVSRPENRVIVAPNVDTPYTAGRVDLRAEPLVLGVPAIAGRYYSFQLMDAYTNVFGYVGTRTTGTQAGDVAIVGPDHRRPLPAGMRVLRSPTNDVMLLGRTLLKGQDEAERVALRQIVGSYTLTPLSTVVAGGERRAAIVLDENPGREPPATPTGLEFFDALGAVLADDPPPAADAPALRAMRRFGIGPGTRTSQAGLSAAVRAALERAVRDGPGRIAALAAARERASARKHDGWVLLDPKTGNAGTDYALRAVVARVGLWANTPAEATYPIASRDATGRRLSGAHRYLLRFPAAGLPPVRSFWSLTMYDGDGFLYANPLNRYAVGDRTTGLRRDRDGGLTIHLQHARPPGRASNWLPAPAGPFRVMLRLYVPRPAALDGRWVPPGIVRLTG
jgi:hypothetical protein